MSVGNAIATQLDDVLVRAVARKTLPGVAAVITDVDETVYVGAKGRLSIDGSSCVASDTMFRIASMTKPLTSVAALQLVEAGRVRLDQEVVSVIPRFGELQVLEGFDGATPKLRAPRRQATVRHLLSHTSGHGYWWTNAALARYRELTGFPSVLDGRLEALHAPLIADPGERWEYGISTDWLGRVIETVSGQDLGQYMAENVLGPLQMHETTFVPSGEQRERLMAMHDRQPGGGLDVSAFDFAESPEFLSGGHGLYSTALDYARFMRMILRGGELGGARVLRSDTVELAFSDQLGGVELPAFVPTQAPWLLNDVVALPQRQSWGLGFQLMLEDIAGMRPAGSGFWSGVVNTYFWIDRAAGLAVAIMTQLLPLFDAAMLETVGEFEAVAYSQLSPADR